MKTVSSQLLTDLATTNTNTVKLKVEAEWLHNNFYRTVVDNTPTEDTAAYDIEMFPIESITKQNRPLAGINKACVNQAFAEPEFHSFIPAARYYMTSVDDQYKYWQSPLPSAPTTNILTNCAPQVSYVLQDNDITGNPVPTTVIANKIHFTVENTYAAPTSYDVQAKTTTGGSWATVASNIAIPKGGKVELYYNGSSWTTTKDLTHTTTIYAVRLVVNNMIVGSNSRVVPNVVVISGKALVTAPGGSYDINDINSNITGTGIQALTTILNIRDYYTADPVTNIKTFYTEVSLSLPATSSGTNTLTSTNATPKVAYFNLIELGAALQLDLSADVSKQSTQLSMGQVDFITPLGDISSNTGKLVLMSEDRKYDNQNSSSILFGLVDKGVKFTAWYVINGEAVQEFEMFSDTWDETSTDGTVTVNLKDNTQMFMDVKPRTVLYQNMPVQEIVWRICDMIGFNNYVVTDLASDADSIVDIFWNDGTKTAWEIFAELSRGSQTAIYFDSYGKLNVVTRGAAWNNTVTPDYTLTRTSSPTLLANIVDLQQQSTSEANKVTVNWKPTGFSEIRDNVVPYEVVWQPVGDVVLRASELVADIVSTSLYITLGQQDGSSWPFKGWAQIQGEWIAYEGKRYQWYNPLTGLKETVTLKDLASQQKLDAKTGAFYRSLNMYTGQLVITERGAYNTDVVDHLVTMSFGSASGQWRKSIQRNYAGNTVNPAGHIQNIASSTYTITTNTATEVDYSYLHRGAGGDAPIQYLGTKLKIDASAHKSKIGGIAFNLQGGSTSADTSLGNGAGYYVEVTATVRMNATMRKTKNEIIIYSMNSSGVKTVYGGQKIIIKNKGRTSGGKKKVDIGAQYPVPQETYLELDIRYVAGTSDTINLYVNGQFLMTAVIPAGATKQTPNGRFGVYARGQSKVTFDYVYASANSIYAPIPLDDESYFDRIQGGYYGNQVEKDWHADTRSVSRKVAKKWYKWTQRYNQRLFEEFGPIAHEIRKFDVEFTGPTPSLESKVYFSNQSQVIIPWYWGDPKHAHFLAINTGRQNAILNGDDSATISGQTISQKLFVYGRPVIQKDQQSIIKTDDASIRRRGIIEITYDSPWIQNEAESINFSNWLVTHWSNSDAEAVVDIYGNPLIELTDLVTVQWYDINSQYYVTAIDNEYDSGIKTKLTLRKAN